MFPDEPGHLPQDAIARDVPKRVVVALEEVEVEHDDGEGHACHLRIGDALLEAGVEGGKVEEPGEVIGLGAQLDVAVQPGILHSSGEVRGYALEEGHMLGTESVGFESGQGEKTYRLVAGHQRHGYVAADTDLVKPLHHGVGAVRPKVRLNGPYPVGDGVGLQFPNRD